MVRRVLVANRGEIALRIIRACRELAVESVAVFSDADRHAPHVLAADRAVRAAIERVGLPALVKASAGGGGKGMRRVGDVRDIDEAIQAARREARAAFGDGMLYVERLVERPHHVEVQIFADGYGHAVHLFERECSLQRRHQKIIEETPSLLLNPALRARMTSAAVAIARAAGY